VLGYREKPQKPIGSLLIYAWSFVGAFAGLALVCLVNAHIDIPRIPGTSEMAGNEFILVASLGATAILEYNAIASPLAQPRNVIFGQALSAIVGVAITKGFEHSSQFNHLRWLAGALSCATASIVMGLTNSIHPPAGATALLAATSADITYMGWYLVPLVLIDSVVILGVACLVNNIQRQFPMYWWTEAKLAVVQEGNQDIEKAANLVFQVECLENGAFAIRPVGGNDPETIVLDGARITGQEKDVLEGLKSRVQGIQG
jgi:CBS-domain-containing membrane protein